MEQLIHELCLPRQINPSPAAIRAAKLLQEIHARSQQDVQARIRAEQQLTEAFGDIQRLTKELNDAKETIAKLSLDATRIKSGVPDATPTTDEMPS